MRNILFALTFFAALTLIAPTAFAERGEGKRDNKGKGKVERERNDNADRKGNARAGMMDPFEAKPSEAMKAEMKRHLTVVRANAKEMAALAKEIRTAVKAAIEKAKADAEANPDAEEPADKRAELKKVVDAVRAQYKEKLKAIATKIVDEVILHTEKKLAIMKAERDAKIEECTEEALNPKNMNRGRRNGERGNGNGEGEGNGEGRNRGDRPNRGDKPNRGNGDRPERGERPNR